MTKHDDECDALWIDGRLVRERCTKQCKARKRKPKESGE